MRLRTLLDCSRGTVDHPEPTTTTAQSFTQPWDARCPTRCRMTQPPRGATRPPPAGTQSPRAPPWRSTPRRTQSRPGTPLRLAAVPAVCVPHHRRFQVSRRMSPALQQTWPFHAADASAQLTRLAFSGSAWVAAASHNSSALRLTAPLDFAPRLHHQRIRFFFGGVRATPPSTCARPLQHTHTGVASSLTPPPTTKKRSLHRSDPIQSTPLTAQPARLVHPLVSVHVRRACVPHC